MCHHICGIIEQSSQVQDRIRLSEKSHPTVRRNQAIKSPSQRVLSARESPSATSSASVSASWAPTSRPLSLSLPILHRPQLLRASTRRDCDRSERVCACVEQTRGALCCFARVGERRRRVRAACGVQCLPI